MREEVESPDLDLGSAIGDVSRSLDSLLIGNLGVVSGSTPLESLIGSIGAGLDTKALIGELGAALDPPPLGSLIGSIGAGLDTKALIGKLGAGLDPPPLGALIGSIGAGLDTKAPIGELSAGLDSPPLGALVGSIGAGLDTKALIGELGAGLDSPPLGAFFGAISAGLDTKALIGELGAGLDPPPLGSLIGSIGAGLDTKALIGELGAGLDPPPLGSLIGSIGAGLDAKPFDLRLYQPLAGGVTAEPSLALPESVVGGVVPIPSPECWALNTGVLAERPLTSEDDGDTDASLECALDRIDPAFATQSRGAMLRSEERGADWLTQAAALLRKLLLGVLHTVAPNEPVRRWVTQPKTQLDQQGRPTRRTKID